MSGDFKFIATIPETPTMKPMELICNEYVNEWGA
jgi:hypothetical protein